MTRQILESQKGTQRESGMELLRIFACLLIIAYHYCIELDYRDASIINRILYCALGSWGGAGVLIFIAISSFFLCDENLHWSFWKEIKLIMETSFYSLMMVFVYVVGLGESASIFVFIKALFSPLMGTYWFITSYLLFYMLIPFLHKFIWSLSEKQLRKAVIVFTFTIILFQMIILGNASYGIISVFCYIYILVAYVKRTDNNFFEKKAISICGICYLIMFALVFFGNEIQVSRLISWGDEKTSIFVILFSVCITFHFSKIKIGNVKIINMMGSTVLGVYLLHQHYLTKDYIWNILQIFDAYRTPTFILHLVFWCLIIYLSGTVIDTIRQMILEKPLFLFFKKMKIFQIFNAGWEKL